MTFFQQPLVAAAQRALLGAALTFGATFMTAYYTQNSNLKLALGAAGAAAFAYLVARIGGEGLYDQATKPTQNAYPMPGPAPVIQPTPSPSPASNLAPGTSVRLDQTK